MTVSVACLGEAMVEISRKAETPDQGNIGFAGDTLNTAIYLARAGGDAITTDYITRLGRDSFSDELQSFIQGEGVGTHQISRSQTSQVGLYTITTDPTGERSFTYWRGQSAAREMFGKDDNFRRSLRAFDVLYFSAISLAILSDTARADFLAWLPEYRANGGRVAFDSNYRPALWSDVATARAATMAAWAQTDIALPSVDDEMALFADVDADAVIGRLRAAGVVDGALKCGQDGPLTLASQPIAQTYAAAARVLDTTAAGDSFNGGYLAARLAGKTQAAALRAGHDLAAKVIGHRGAIIPA